MILFYSDQHLRDYGSFPPFNVEGEFGLTKETINTLKGFLWVAACIEKLKPELVINLGDVFHNHDFISTRTLHASTIAFEAVAKACKTVSAQHVIIAGNHDIYSQSEGYNNTITSISLMKSYAEIKTKPCHVTLKDGFKVGLVPYSHSTVDAYNALSKADQDCGLIATHLDFEGAFYENRVESKSKISPHTQNPIVSGHLHTPQEIGSVRYCGSLTTHRFSSHSLNVGGVVLFDPKKSEFKRMKNTASQHYLKLDLDRCIEKHGKIPYSTKDVCLQVYSEKPLEMVEKYLTGYDYVFLNKQISLDTEAQHEIGDIDNPLKTLRDKVKTDNPPALKILDQFFKPNEV